MYRHLHFLLPVILVTIFVKTSSAQRYQGNTMIDLYYGYSLDHSQMLYFYQDDSPKSSYTLLGPINVRHEYMISDKVGVGVDFTYRSFIYGYYRQTNNPTTGTPTTYYYKYTKRQWRIMGRVNVHFVNTEESDFYASFGMGYKNSLRFTESNNPLYDDFPVKAIFPVASRLAMGYRYFISPNLAVGVEVGIGGGSLANGGLSYAF